MSEISRRNFMKCAGAAALAVAASGMLAGCGDNTLDVVVTFVYNGQNLPLTGTGKVVVSEPEMDTKTVVLPAEYQEKYEIRDEKVKVSRGDDGRTAVVELVAKMVTWPVSYRLDGKQVLSGSVVAAALDPVVTAKDLNSDELTELGEAFYQLPEKVDITIDSDTVVVPVEKIMGEVSVKYVRWNSSDPGNENKDDVSRYKEYSDKAIFKIWKGQKTISTGEMSNLKKAQDSYKEDYFTYKRTGSGSGWYAKDYFTPATEFDIDWTNPVVKVYLYSSASIMF